MTLPVQELFPLLFLGLFQGIGGLAAGSGLRPLLFERSGSGTFLIIWGAGFGGIPTCIGAALALGAHTPLLALVGPAIFGSALLGGLVVVPALVREFGVSTLVTVGMGALFLLIGFGAGLSLIRSHEVVGGLVFGAIFGLVGALLTSLGVWSLIGDKPSTSL